MKPQKVRKILYKFIVEIASDPTKDLKVIWKDTLKELSEKLSKKFNTEQEVKNYLDYVLEYMDGLNKFFAKKGSGYVPYSKLFQFANKDERLSEYLFDLGVHKKFSKKNSGIEIAGHVAEEEEDDEINIIFENEIYSQIYASSSKGFFFSSAINSFLVRNSNGKMRSYKQYKKRAVKKGIYYTKLNEIYKALSGGIRTEAMDSFLIYIRDLRNERKTKKN
jgi:hypothetical protein